jgi:hypothetical protein
MTGISASAGASIVRTALTGSGVLRTITTGRRPPAVVGTGAGSVDDADAVEAVTEVDCAAAVDAVDVIAGVVVALEGAMTGAVLEADEAVAATLFCASSTIAIYNRYPTLF